jgi:hypothetical protein
MTEESEHRVRPSATVAIALCLSLLYVAFQCELQRPRALPAEASRVFFRDSDDYMRMDRVRRIESGESRWRVHLVREHGYPHGAALHWTRPQDLLLLGLAKVFSPLSGSAERARERAGLWIGPLLETFVLVWLAWWGSLALGALATSALLLLFALSGATSETFALAHPDHHGLILACSIVGLCAASRAGQLLRLEPTGRGPLVWAALSACALSLGLWTAVETAATWAVVTSGWALAALVTRDGPTRAALRRVGLGWSGVGLGLTLVAHWSENGSARLLAFDLDRVSLACVLLWGVPALWFALGVEAGTSHARERNYRRLATGLALGLLLPLVWLATLRLAAPPPAGEAAAMLWRWFGLIVEFQPLGAGPGASLWGEVWSWLGLPILALPPALAWLWLYGRDPLPVRLQWLLAALLFTGLTAAQVRWTGLAAFVTAVVVGLGLGRASERAAAWSPRRTARLGTRSATSTILCIAAALALGSAGLSDPLGGDSLRARQATAFAEDTLRVRELTRWLDRNVGAPDEERPAVMTPWWVGPQVLYETGRPVVASPYHGNLEGIADSARFYLLESDAEAAALLRERCAGWVVVPSHAGFALEGRLLLGLSERSPSPADPLAGLSRDRFERTLLRRLQGDPPGFPAGFSLAAVGAHGGATRLPPYRLFRVRDPMRAVARCRRD